jgi:histidine ammonia-lyase
VDRLLDATRSQELPPFLATDPGVNSGLMLAQYTAAVLVAENRRLAVPASVDSIPTSSMREDHVSMGWHAARKLRRVLANPTRILAVEVLCAAAGRDLRVPLQPAPATATIRDLLRTRIPAPGPDRFLFLAPELEAAEELVRAGQILLAISDTAGQLD